jgi:hypothetical protein
MIGASIRWPPCGTGSPVSWVWTHLDNEFLPEIVETMMKQLPRGG